MRAIGVSEDLEYGAPGTVHTYMGHFEKQSGRDRWNLTTLET